jgi:hypothetical protein
MMGTKKVYKPDPRESALLFLRMMQEREKRGGKRIANARVSEVSIRRLCGREVIAPQFMDEFRDWLLTFGWALFDAGLTFGAVRTEVVMNWPRCSADRISAERESVFAGKFDFEKLAGDLADYVGGESSDDEQDSDT